MPVLTSITGSDGKNPIYDPEALFRFWNIDDIYTGAEGHNRYVPKINDYVIRPMTYETWRVVSIDPITFIPVLQAVKPWGGTGEMAESDILFGVGPGTQAQLLRAYINRASHPYKLTVDTHCFVGGTMNAYAVIYRNGVPETGGEPVSRMYDNSGNFLGVEVPLELVALNEYTNSSMKVVGECSTVADIEDGTPLYVVFYSADGVVQSKAMVLAENTTYIRGLDVQRKFVTNISLESPWLSAADANVLEYPLNIPVDALGLIGVVHYNVGPPLKLPVDGTKFQMPGLNGFISSIPNEKFDLALIYNLSENEISYAGQGLYVNRKVTAPYSVVTKVVEPGYSVKLFMFPFWDILSQSYRLRFWLYNMARTSWVEVTEHVAYSPDYPVFDPRGYGLRQRLQVNLNLRRVSMSYKPMIHTQVFDVTLYSSAQDNVTPWVINTQITPNKPGFGRDVYLDLITSTTYTLRSNYQTLTDWLRAFYFNTEPIVDLRTESTAATPTHFWVSTDNAATWTQYSVEDSWDQVLVSATPITIYQNVLVRFTKPVQSSVLQLSICNVLARQTT